MQSHQSGGGPMNSSQFQELQKMQRLQQVQAQFRQQQQAVGQRQSQQQLISGTNLGNMHQGLPQMQQTQFSNQQWMDQTQQSLGGHQGHRNSLSGMTNPAVAMMQQQAQSGSPNMGMGSNSAQGLYWNPLQGNKGSSGGMSSGMDPSGGSSLGLGGMGMGGSAGKLGMMDSSMQALLQQQSNALGMGTNQQNQMRMSGQQQMGNGKADLSAMSGLGGSMMGQQQMQMQLRKMGSSSTMLPGTGDPQGQLQNAGNANAQYMLLDSLKRQLGQPGGGNTSNSSSNAMLNQQQQQILQMQQRNNTNATMLQQMSSGMMQDQSRRSSSTLLQGQQAGNGMQSTQSNQRKGSLSNTEPISMATLMGQSQQGSLTMPQMGRRSSGNSQGNALLGMLDGSGGAGGANMLMQQQQAQVQLQQMAKKSGMDSLGGMGTQRSGSMNDQLLVQQQQFLNASGMGQMGSEMQKQLLMGQSQSRSNSQILQTGGSNLPQFQQDLMAGLKGSELIGDAGLGVDSTDKSMDPAHTSKSRRSSSSRQSKKKDDHGDGSSSQSFLDGTFVGGWQSNADIPDRRNIIFNICTVIEQTRPDASKMPQKLPYVAKRLEEHLYRSAKTKEEYLDPSTLKKRLQTIAHGIEEQRSSSGSSKKDSKSSSSHMSSSKMGDIGLGDASSQKLQQQMQQMQQMQQLQQLQQQQKMGNSLDGLNPMMMKQSDDLKQDLLRQQAKMSSQQQSGLSNSSGLAGETFDPKTMFGGNSQQMPMSQLQDSVFGSQQGQSSQRQGSFSKGSSGSGTTGILKTGSSKFQDPQKRKVIKQQQQRLLLLRHASKCKAGSSCKVKFCGQMVALWKHMKKCRDKNCKTAHCLSSRCVLNHYRTCKSENKTSTCEVCGPVMRQIKQQNSQSTEVSGSNDKDPLPADINAPVPSRQASQSAADLQNAADAVAQQKRQQLEELQAAQQKLQQQHSLLKQLQAQQAQLLDQQKQLQQQQQHVLPQTQQGQQLQQQQALLQKLQQEFQQQQMLLQQDLLQQSQALQSGQSGSSQQIQMPPNLSMSSVKSDGSKAARRTSASRRGSRKAERQASGSSKGKAARIRAVGGKGKRLSALETHISHNNDDNRSVSTEKSGISSVDSLDGGSVSNKRPIDEITSDSAATTDEPPAKAAKTEPEADSTPKVEPESPKSQDEQKRVLEQGDADQTTSLIPSMPPATIEKHLESLNDTLHLTPRTITQKCLPIITRLLEDQFGWVFRDPVDPDVLGLPDYFEVVKTPMHLDLIKKKLENGIYKEMDAFERDTKLVFENAILYNGEDSEVGEMAQSMIDRFVKDYASVYNGIKMDHDNLMRKGDMCSLCGLQRRLFEPTVLYCSGACGMQKIRRNAFYYTDRSKSNHWCVSCYALIKDEEAVVLDDGSSVRKTELQKFKNDALPEEAWVQCDCCDSWVHQICALFNGRKNKTAASYLCPKCHLNKVGKGGNEIPKETMKGAQELPHCTMSEELEKGLEATLQRAYEERSSKQGVSIDKVEKAVGLSVRVISNIEKKHIVRDLMFQRYGKAGCASEFPVRSKCVALFQRIHGVDVMLFGMYVYEYGHEAPAPNRRRVYISYLDSVKYFQPKCYRTTAYHALLVEYLRFVKDRGFHTAHIWSCPPSPGDDYIFHCHPSHQLIPKDDMLRSWYSEMLEKAKSEGVVMEVSTLYDEYFRNNGMDATSGPAADPTCLPYFEGDYIPGEIDNIIKELLTEEEAKRKNRDDPLPLPNANKKVGKKLGTRSNPGELVNIGQDKVMLRLGQAMSNMRQNFMVVQLRSRAFAAAVERGDDVSNWVDDGQETSKRMKIGGKDSSVLYPSVTAKPSGKPLSDGDGARDGADAEAHQVEESGLDGHHVAVDGQDQQQDIGNEKEVHKGDDDIGSLGTVSVSLGPSADTDDGQDDDPSKTFGTEDTQSDEAKEKEHLAGVSLDGMGSGAGIEETGQTGAKRGFEEIGPTLSRHFAAMQGKCIPVPSTEDKDAPQEVEMFESRQQFLNYCQTNHFQFDELRRAKHTTMMMLFQLHNPNAPKFLQQCGACYREITHGTRYHCNDCSNFDLCEQCYEPVTTGKWAQKDSRFAHDSSHTFTPIDAEAAVDEQRNREERSRTIKAHMELLTHAATCEGPPACTLNNCQRMKKLFEHVRTCDVTPKKSCKICTRVLTLLSVHARMCTVRGACPLPFCDRIREKIRRRKKQQQRMDDRRRQAQNQLYRLPASGAGD